MATFNCKGIENLIKRFDDMAEITDKCKEEIVSEAAEEILRQQKEDAPVSTEDENSDGTHGKDYLDIVDERSGEGYLFKDIGINSKNWSKTRGLYFQNYGGQRSSGEYILWMEKSFKKAQASAKKIIKAKLKKELKL